MTRRQKIIYFYFIMIALTWIVIEAISIGGHIVLNRSFFPKNEIKKEIRSIINAEEIEQKQRMDKGLRWGDFIEVVHPYFGFVADPYRNEDHIAVSNFGFSFSKGSDPIVKRTESNIIVGIFGGSFATGAYLSARSMLKDCLQQSGEEVIVRNFAGGGYKQPQQLLILAYLLSLGAEFDIIINIDGFNEVALPISENIPVGVNPFYPRRWNDRVATMIDPVKINEIGHIKFLETKRGNWARLINNYKLYRSPTLALVWQYRDRILKSDIYQIRKKIMEENKTASKSYAGFGPEYLYANDDDIYHDLADIWLNSSVQIQRISEKNDAKYYHFLQPNQYLKDTKPMTEEEKRIALNRAHPYREGVTSGFPFLMKRSEILAEKGVNFTDLTKIYVNNTDLLYVDDCCHVNEKGYDLVVSRICETIQKDELRK